MGLDRTVFDGQGAHGGAISRNTSNGRTNTNNNTMPVAPSADSIQFDQTDPTHRTIRVEVIKIEPTMLAPEELDYELSVRGLQVTGKPRERTLRLREALSYEKKTGNYPKDSVVNFSPDAHACHEGIQQVEAVLRNDWFEQPVLQRLATSLAHLEGRVSRLFAMNSEEKEYARELYSRVEECIHLYLEKAMNQATRRPQVQRQQEVQNVVPTLFIPIP